MPVVQKQIDDQQLDLNVNYTLVLDQYTFVDPNGDNLTYSIVGTPLPKWLSFDANQLAFNGTPKDYGIYNISVMAKDAWNASAVMNFEIVAGIKPNYPPVVTNPLSSQLAFVKELFYYRFPADTFTDPDEQDTVYLLVSQANGNYLPGWLTFEEITRTLSGIPNPDDPLQNVTEVTQILVIADDRRGGSAMSTFNITLMRIEPVKPSMQALIIVSILMGVFLIVMVAIICKKTIKCRRKRRH